MANPREEGIARECMNLILKAGNAGTVRGSEVIGALMREWYGSAKWKRIVFCARILLDSAVAGLKDVWSRVKVRAHW